MNNPSWLDLLWRVFTVAGTIGVYLVWRHLRTLSDPLARARLAALALAITASAIWAAMLLDELARWAVKDPLPPVLLLGMRLTWHAVVYGLALVVPGWLPRLLLAGNPGPSRARLVVVLGGFTLFLLGIVMVTTGMLTLFAASVGEWLEGLFDVGIPVLMVGLVALTMIRAVREMGGGFPPGHRAG
ncbi:MAG TPA: hypothetical protein VJ802_10250 [Gemmatimonadaceae bacterium]|nr:hypothetical protein [Gemmatimonadaceae bacterium]